MQARSCGQSGGAKGSCVPPPSDRTLADAEGGNGAQIGTTFLESARGLVGAGRFERPTHYAHGGLSEPPKWAIFRAFFFELVGDR